MAPEMNIVIFGEVGAGKSSVINLMAGRHIAHTSPDSHRCSTQPWTEYPITFENGTRYRVFDTFGLERPPLQTGDSLITILNAYGLIKTLRARGGANLLLFCIRGGRVRATMEINYRFFFKNLFGEKVPLVLVVTNLERETKMEDWYTRNVVHLEKHNIGSAGHACITAANFLDGRLRDNYEESRGILRRVVEAHCNASMEGWTGGQRWLASFITKLAEFIVGRSKKPEFNANDELMYLATGRGTQMSDVNAIINLLDFLARHPKPEIIEILTERCGIAKEVAREVAQQIGNKHLPQPRVKNRSHTSVPSDVRNTYLQQEHHNRPRNVVILGESGVGKSSLINLIIGRDVAETSPDALATTVDTAPYDVTIRGQNFRLWDTVGLNEGSEGRVPAAAAANKLTQFLGDLSKGDGVHLLVNCVRGTRITRAMRTNYQTFISAIGHSKVPIVIVATCLEDFHPVTTEWWNQSKDQLAKYGRCVSLDMLVSQLSRVKTQRPGVYANVVHNPTKTFAKLILDHCSQIPLRRGTPVPTRNLVRFRLDSSLIIHSPKPPSHTVA